MSVTIGVDRWFDYAARWGWGVRPEANLDPKFVTAHP